MRKKGRKPLKERTKVPFSWKRCFSLIVSFSRVRCSQPRNRLDFKEITKRKNSDKICQSSVNMNIFRIGSPPSSDRVTVNYIYDLEAKLTGVEYVITAAIASDAGTYECRASNKLNVVTKTIAVSVTSAAWVSDWQGMKLIVNILTLKIWLKVLPTFCNPFNFKSAVRIFWQVLVDKFPYSHYWAVK